MKTTLTSRLLTTGQMRSSEQRAIQGGISGWEMMQAAGKAAAERIVDRFPPQPVLVLCGPGNNGGDGFVIAQALYEEGWPVTLTCMKPREQLAGDAATAAQHYCGPVVTFTPDAISEDMLIIDALFGTGLERPPEGAVAAILERVNARGNPVVAVDIPSGIHGDSGKLLGIAPIATLTVTFAAKKPAHLLLPGRLHAGEVQVADIGIAAQVEEVVEAARTEGPLLAENSPALWQERFAWAHPSHHKYSRGSVLVAGGPPACTGAARMAAYGAARIGAGAVTVACSAEALPIYASHLTSIMTCVTDTPHDFARAAAEKKYHALLVGPGLGVSNNTREITLGALLPRRGRGADEQGALATQGVVEVTDSLPPTESATPLRLPLKGGVEAHCKPVVLDADALSVFAGQAQVLFSAIQGPAVLTPHEGEFARLFGGVVAMEADKLTRAREAARASGAVVVLKGADTVIAAPDGIRAVINSNAPPDLATAGAGDVLSGMVAGLLACGMDTFDAACAAVWLHSEAATHFGPGLLAEDLPGLIPGVLNALEKKQESL